MESLTLPKILIVDDEPELVEVLTLALKQDYKITSFQSAHDICRKVEFVKPDLILMDVILHAYNGIAASKELKINKATWDIPVLLMTARSNTKGFIEDARAEDLIKKPFNLADLRNRIASMCKISQEKKYSTIH